MLQKITASTFAFLLFTLSFSALAQNKAEYFFDSDPGKGSGTSLTLAAGDSVTISPTISVSSLSAGFHVLYVRSRMGGRWSQTESRGFFKMTTVAAVSRKIKRFEYYFDTDPGVGSAFQITGFTTADSVENSRTISISSLSSGFHTLYIRSQDETNAWSQTETRPFYITPGVTASAGPISRLEYFFDTDPGVGAGTSISISPSADSTEKIQSIPITALASGFHTIYVRAKNNRGWSMAESRTFFVTTSASLTAGPISQLEYFFDTDPGIGLATKITVNPTADSSEKTSVIPISSLSAGFHTLHIRARNNKGWSQTETRSFYIYPAASLTSGPVAKMEYFIDTDPGVGLGTALTSFTSGDSVSVTRVISVPSNLATGVHKIYIRSQTTDKRWAITEVQDFTVDCAEISITATQTQICSGASTTLSFASGNQPGTYQWYRNGNLIPGATAFLFTTTQTGGYTLRYQFGTCLDTSDVLAIGVGTAVTATATASGSTNICAGSSVNINANSGTGLTYQWLLNSNPISGQTGIQLANVAASGSYAVIVTNGTGCKDTSNPVPVVVTPLPPKPSISANGPLTFCDGGSVVLTTTAASGRWSTGETTTSITVSGSAIIRDTAIVNGCKIVSDPIAITENPCNDLPGSGNALRFDGVDDFVTAPHNPAFAPASVTAEAWVKVNAFNSTKTGGNTSAQYIVFKPRTTGGKFEGYVLTFDDVAKKFVAVVTSASAVQAIATSTTTVELNRYYHVSVTANSSSLKLYVNGILESTVATGFPLSLNTDPLQIGQTGNSSFDGKFNGNLDEVRIWNLVLTEAQIRDRMCRKIPATDALFNNLVGYFNFDETSGNAAYNQAASPDVDGTLTNGVVRETSGAPIGDDAVPQFQSTGFPAVTFTNGTQETFQTSFIGGTASGERGAVVYVVKEKPNSETGISGVGTNDRYYGVFSAGFTNPQYTAVYNYGTNPFVTAGNENSLALFKRTDNSVSFWTNASAVRNTTANTMSVNGQSTEYMLGIGAGGEVNPGTIGSDQTVSCSNLAPVAFTSLADATTTTGFPITYQWQDSTKGGSWQNIATATASTFAPPVLSDTTWFRRKATASTFSQFTNIVVVNIQAVVAGDPTVYGTNVWNLYAWDGTDINLGNSLIYKGFYTVGGLSVNTQNEWGNGVSPSSSATWQGCAVQVDNFTWTLRRKGFPAGSYIMNVPSNDDQINVLVNGTSVYTGNCCGGAANITLGALGASDSVEVRMVEFGGGANVSFAMVTSALQAGSISSSQLICGGGIPAAFTSTQNAFGGPTLNITYQWQDSTKGGSWQNIATATSATFQAGTLSDTAWYRRIAKGGIQTAISNIIEVQVAFVVGDASVFPLNSWNLYGYSGTDLELGTGNAYKGFYTINALDLNTQDQWGAGVSPSSATGYQGCPVPTDNFIFVLKRKGFPGGQYTLNILNHDDGTRVYLNGVQVFEHIGCCDTHNGIDLGTLGSNSTLEVRTVEGGGSAQIALQFILSDFQGGTIAADQNICSGSTPAQIVNVAEASGGSVGTVTYQWQDSTVSGTWQNIALATANSYQPGILTATTWYRRKATGGTSVVFSNEVQISVLPAPTVSVTPLGPIGFCLGGSQTLTGTFSTGTTRQWLRNGLVISGQNAATLVVAQSGSYKAVAFNGSCTDTSNAVIINVNPKPAPIVTPGGPLTLCQGSSIDLDWANPVAGQTIQWKKNGLPVVGGNTLSANSEGSYYLVATFTATGCIDSSNVVVINVVNPQVTPIGPVNVCAGNSQILTVSNVGTADIQWFRNNTLLTNETNPTISITQAGTYRVDASVGTTCTVSSNDVVANAVTPPTATITPLASLEFCSGGSVTLEANTGTGLTYQWRRNTQNISNATNPTFLATQSGDYTVEVTNAGNCSTVSSSVTLTEVPNVTWFMDVDGDNYAAGVTVQNCTRPLNGFLASELTATTGDCNDNDATINPGRQFFTFSGAQGFASALTSPLTGTSYTNFRFEVTYTDLNNNPPPATFPRVILDYEGNGQLNNANDRTILMTQTDDKDLTTNNGKKYFATVNSLPSGQDYTTRILTSIGNCATTIGPFNYPDVFILSDLQIFANDITFSNTNPDVSSPLTVSAVIHNVSDFSAQNFVVHLVNQYNPSIVYPDIVVPNLAPHSDQTVTWNITTPAEAAWCPMQVDIDFTNIIEETNELDNSAIRPFVNGPFNVPGEITVSPSVSPSTVVGVSGASVTLVGVANYSGTAVPLADPSVAGAQVTFTTTPGGQTYTTYTNSSGQINFSFYVPLTPGTYTITGTITDFTLTTNFTTTFTVVPPVCLVDLSANVTISSHNIVEGEDITGNIRVTNSGCEPSVDSTLLSISQSGGLPIMVNVKVPPLAVNAFYDVAIPPITFNTPGTYTICGTADGAFAVAEQSEGNNADCEVLTVIPFLPDIFPVGCGVSGSVYLSSQTYTHTFSFYNSGGSATGPFTVRILQFRDGNQIGTFDKPVADLARQSYGSVSIDVVYDQIGAYTYSMACDIPVPPGVVTETDETNNTSGCFINVMAPQTDLYVSGCENFDVDPVDPPFPGNITLKARVGNAGNLTATAPITVRFTRTSGTIENVVLTNDLAPGQSVLVTKIVPSTSPGTDTATVTVDPQNVFAEFNESNNATSNFLCHESAPVDNYCGFNWWTSTYLINQAIFLNVPVVVRGIYNISELKVRFFVSGPGLNGTLNLGDATLNNVTETCGCPYIATLPVNFAFPAEGVYTFTFITDPDNLYTECIESNNTLVKQVRVSGLPDMRMLSQGINPSLLNPDVGEPITIDANYENIGLANIDQTMKVKLLVDEIAVDSQTVNGLVTGDNFTVNFATPWSSTLVGSHIIRTIIDADNVVEENNESNNEATRAVIVGAAANLYFQVFQPSNSSPALGNNITIQARIGNAGDVPVDGVVQFFYINNQNDTVQIGQLGLSLIEHDSVTLNLPWIVADNNTVLIGKIVNASVMEFNYEDNMATAPIGGFAVTTTSTPACAGKPDGTLTANPSGGTAPFTVTWSTGFIGPVLTSGPGLYSGTVTDANNVSVNFAGSIPNIVGTKYYQDADGDGHGNPAVDSIDCTKPFGYVLDSIDCNDGNIALYKKTGKPSISHSGSLTFCAGGSVTLSVPISNFITYKWSTSETTNSILVSTAGSFTVEASQDSGCTATSNPIVTQVITNLIPIAGMTVSPDSNVCTGTQVTFTAIISGGGTNPTLEWLVNNLVVANGGTTFSSNSLNNNDVVQVRLTSSESCASPATVLSNSISMTIGNSLSVNAGTDQTICTDFTQLAATGSGTWTALDGDPSFSDESSPATQITHLEDGLNRFVWTVTSGNCPAATDTVNIFVQDSPTMANAGSYQEVCDDSTSLDGNPPSVGTGTWSVITGSATVIDPVSPTSVVTNLSVGDNILVWSITNGACPASTDTLTITRHALPSVSNAGPDQTICGDVTQMAAEVPTVGTGRWRLVQGTATFTDSLSSTMAVAGLSSGENKFVWIVANGTCPETTDTVSIFVNPFADPANAGLDQTVCDDSTSLAAAAPLVGIGTWSVVSGQAVFGDPNAATSSVENLSSGINKLVWTITNGTCPASTDTVIIFRETPPSLSVAGLDDIVCSDTARLKGNSPSQGLGQWTLVSGSGIVEIPSDPKSKVIGLGLGDNLFAWTISSGTCSVNADTVVITRADPIVVDLGPDSTICEDWFDLHPNPSTGGVWTVLAGGGSMKGNSLFTTTGLNTVSYTVTGPGGCIYSDTVNVIRVDSADAQAGPDQILCSQTTTTLSAIAPITGTGSWSVISGTAVVIEPTNPTSGVTGLSFGEHILRWTVINDPCPAVFDEMTINITNSLVANAGKDSTICQNSITLTGNGQGVWSLVSGLGTISTPNSATTSITNLGVGVNVFQWKLISNGCPSDSDEVAITVTPAATVAHAGSDQALCVDSANLSGNVPTVGDGMWMVISGTGVVADPLAAASTVHSLSTGVNQLVWMISNACGENSDTVSITVSPLPTVANAGPDDTLCAAVAPLQGNTPASGTGLWTVIQGGGFIPDPTSPNAELQGMGPGLNLVVWSISVGSCSPSTDTVRITRQDLLTLANAGVDQNICTNETLLDANPSASGLWTVATGTGDFANVNLNNTLVSNLEAGLNRFAWTISNGSCPSSTDTVDIVYTPPPSLANAGLDQVLCINSSTLAADAPSVGTGNWTMLSGGGTVTNPTDPTSDVTNLSVGENQFVWSVSNGICPASADTIRLIVSPAVSAVNAGVDTAVCGSSATLHAIEPLVGAWTVLSGGATIENPSNPLSSIAGMQPGSNQFVWTAGLAPCPVKSDTVVFTSNPSVAANAGSSFVACSDTATLNAISPGAVGTGLWSVDQGSATFANPGLGNTFVSNLGMGLNVLRWTISVPTCPDVSDTIAVFQVQNNLSIHTDTSICFNLGDSLVLTVPSGVALFTWSTGATTPSITLHAADTVVLSVVTLQNCTFTDTIKVQAVICDPVAPLLSDAGLKVSHLPNPATEKVVLSIESLKGKLLQLQIINSLGQEVVPGETITVMGKTERLIGVDKLPTGVYTLRLVGDEFNWSGKVVVQH